MARVKLSFGQALSANLNNLIERKNPMATSLISSKNLSSDSVPPAADLRPGVGIAVGMLTGCQDRPYAFGLSTALVAKGAVVEMIGSKEEDSPEMHTTPNLKFLKLRRDRSANESAAQKLSTQLLYYFAMLRYAFTARPKILHILWNNKFEYFDRVILTLYYKALGKKVTLTAHNVNAARRDAHDSFLNRLTLKIQYRLVDHIFVHTEKMQAELLQDFGIPASKVTVLTHPVIDSFPNTDLTPADAKEKLNIAADEKTILFFGNIRPYKGLEYLVSAFERVASKDKKYRLIIAGQRKKGSEDYWDGIARIINQGSLANQVMQKIEYISEEDTEIYFKAADVLALPYKEIFQSGVLFVAYWFGLPVIAADVGSFREDVIEGQTGLLCQPGDPADLANAIEKYFASDLYRDLNPHVRQAIRDYADSRHSWELMAEMTCAAYQGLLPNRQA